MLMMYVCALSCPLLSRPLRVKIFKTTAHVEPSGCETSVGMLGTKKLLHRITKTMEQSVRIC